MTQVTLLELTNQTIEMVSEQFKDLQEAVRRVKD
jgi:hypothetical protein